MNFENIKDVVTTADLELIQTDIKAQDYSVMVQLNGTEIFRNFYSSLSNVTIYGMGQIIESWLTSFYGHVVINVFDSSNLAVIKSASAIVLRSEIKTEFSDKSLSEGFITTRQVIEAPPLAILTLSVIPEGGRQLLIDGEPAEFEITPDNATYTFQAPEAPGAYRITAGEKSITLFVYRYKSPVAIKYANPFGAPEIIYLDAEIKNKITRKASSAAVMGDIVSYDTKREASFEIEAKNLSELQMKALEALAFGNDIEINTVPVHIDELETSRSRTATELFEIKITAIIRKAGMQIFTQEYNRIFRQQFQNQFQ